MSFRGKFIIVEGLEGSGKSTAITTIVDCLQSAGIKHLITREPGGTVIGEQLRTIIKNPDYKELLDDKTELLLLYASRNQLLNEVIKPALEKNTWVIADRFELSTIAYQGGGRGIDKQFIARLSAFCLNDFKPDLTLYLDVTPEVGMQRAQLRGQLDRIEQQTMDFFHRVHEAYLSAIKETVDCNVIDAHLPVEKVQSTIAAVMQQFIESCRSDA